MPVRRRMRHLSLATDWDTYHSICLAPERTAWMINALGFRGRVNHYVGALWFYELVGAGFAYASAEIDFTGTALFSSTISHQTSIVFGRDDDPLHSTTITHLQLHRGHGRDDREIIRDGDQPRLDVGPGRGAGDGTDDHLAVARQRLEPHHGDGEFDVVVPVPASQNLAGGVDGTWLTDLEGVPRLNRAARDWTLSYFTALKGYGLDGAASLSMELGNGDASVAAGIAQRCPAGDAVMVATPALQTNFSPASLAFWQQPIRT